MALVLADRVRETTTTTGTGTVSLAGPVSGFQGFSTAIGNANTTYYTIADAATGAWEVGLGTYTSSGSTLARTTILSSSNAGAAVNFAAGTKDVFVTQPAERALYLNGAGTGVDAGVAAFTANGVVYASSASALATGSALTFDGTNLLQVNVAAGKLRLGVNTSDQFLDIYRDNGSGASVYNAAQASSFGFHLWQVTGTEKLRLTSTSLYTASGVDVGIGTSTPGAKLDVVTTSGDCIVRLGNGTSQARFAVDSAGPYIYALTSGDDSLRVYSAVGSQAMTLDASGDLQLATTTSSTRTITVGGTNASIALAGSNSGIYFGAAGTPVGSGGFGSNSVIARSGGANFHISGSADGDLCIAPEGTKAILFGTSASAGSVTERARITSGGTFQTSLDASIYGVTVGRGAGAVATNTAVGASALAANTSGEFNLAVGGLSLFTNTGGSNSTAVGYQSAYYQTGGNNTSLGHNSFIGASGTSTGQYNTAIGKESLYSNTTASNNTAVGYQAAYTYSTGGGAIVAIGRQAGYTTNASYGVYVGQTAGYSSTGVNVTHVGFQAGYHTSTGVDNTSLGWSALQGAASTSTGSYNTALGSQALFANTTASNNTAVGYQAGVTNQTGTSNTFVGYTAGYTSNYNGDAYNTAIGERAGYSLTTGTINTFVGSGAGYYVSSGAKNTILGRYSGNQGGLDIRTASNYIVLSDGDGNPHAYNGGSDWYLAPNYRSFLTRGNNGGSSSTDGSANFFKIGTWQVFGQGARATLRIIGAAGFGSGDVNSGETIICLVYQNANTAEGFFYSVAGSGSTAVNNVAFKNTGGAVEIWVKTGTFASTAVFPDCVLSRWEGTYSDTGSGTAPAGSTLLPNYFKYIDSSAANSAITLNQFGVAIGAAVGTSGRGITFPATQDASSNANTLDDYEEGTWTATLVSSGGGSVILTSSAQYTKVGNLVFVAVESFSISTTGLSAGDLTITGLPFTCNINSPSLAYFDIAGAVTASSGSVVAYAAASTTITLLKTESTSSSVAYLAKSDLNSSISLRFNGTYTV